MCLCTRLAEVACSEREALEAMSRLRRSDGFSVAEVVIATAIMFFVLTALVGLMGVSSNMTVQAKQKSILVNAVASEIDRLRALPFDQIQTGDVERDYNGVLVQITQTVETKTAMGSEYYKIVRIAATGTMQGQSLTYRTSIIIRNPENNMTLSTDPDAPQIEFTADAPAADEVFFGAERLNGGSIFLKTRAYSPANGLTEVRYLVGNSALIQASGASAVFTPTNNPYFASPTWNTAAGGLADGFQTVVAVAEDNQQRTATVKRRYIIDNSKPLAPGVPSGVALDSQMVRLTWNAARDGGVGTDPAAWYWASQYQYTLYREPLTGGGAPTSWPVAAQQTFAAGDSAAQSIMNAGPITRDASVTAGGPALSRSSLPFSRFFVRVYSGSPRGMGDAYADSTALVVTRPELICDSSAQSTAKVGSKSGNKYPLTLALNVTKPNFPYTGTPTYSVQYRTPTGTWQPWPSAVTVTQSTNYVTLASTASLSLSVYYLKVGVSGVTPNGYAGGTALPVLETNAAKMPAAAANTTYNLTLDWGL